jgi:hypothetical protein
MLRIAHIFLPIRISIITSFSFEKSVTFIPLISYFPLGTVAFKCWVIEVSDIILLRSTRLFEAQVLPATIYVTMFVLILYLDIHLDLLRKFVLPL